MNVMMWRSRLGVIDELKLLLSTETGLIEISTLVSTATVRLSSDLVGT